MTALRDEADIVITNPPFSLFREFVAWLVEGGRKFSVIGNNNAITYNEIFPLIKAQRALEGRDGQQHRHGVRRPEGCEGHGRRPAEGREARLPVGRRASTTRV